MRYEVKDPEGKMIYQFDSYGLMWSFIVEMKQKAYDKNIDGFIVTDNKSHTFDYAWRVALQMNDLNIGD